MISRIFTYRYILANTSLCLMILFCKVNVAAQTPQFTPLSKEMGIQEVADIADLFGHGASASDYDNDGDIDFFLTTNEKIGHRLYRNDGSGHFEDVALASGIVEMNSGRASLWFDYDGDRLQDLIITNEYCINKICQNPMSISLYKQQADHTFKNTTIESGIFIGTAFDYLPFFGIGGLAAADMNGDNYVDLLLTTWGGGLKYYVNLGNGNFEESSQKAGLISSEKNYWQPMISDFNGDGLLDIYINVDFAGNQLWVNNGNNTFSEQAKSYGLNSAFNEMGMTLGDCDADGDIDIYATNITRNYQGTHQHNILYTRKMKDGKVEYTESSASIGVSQSGWDWGTTFLDINNDGYQDLATTNGWNDPFWGLDRSNFWMGSAAGFADKSIDCAFSDYLSATTLIAFDKDRDGDVDVLQTLKDNYKSFTPLVFYENNLNALNVKKNYTVIQPRMDNANHFALGSQVTVKSNKKYSSKIITAGTSFYGQEPAEAFFGLGNAIEINEVTIKWPNSEISLYKHLPANNLKALYYDVVHPPHNLIATEQGNGIYLDWKHPLDDIKGFEICRASDENFLEEVCYFSEGNDLNYLDKNVEAGKNYFYHVTAKRDTVYSAYSNTIQQAFGKDIDTEPGKIKIQLISPAIYLAGTITSDYLGPMNVSIYDASGKKIWNKIVNKFSKVSNFLEYPELTSGVFFVKFEMIENAESANSIFIKI